MIELQLKEKTLTRINLDVEREEKLLFTQETVALIKPDAAEKSEDIVAQLESCGFTIKVIF